MLGLCVALLFFSACTAGKSVSKQSASRMSEEQLFDTAYTIIAINGENLPETLEKQPSMLFEWAEKRVSGNAGCNNYFGGFTIEQGKIDFSKVGMTLMMCPDMHVEDAFRTAMQAVKSYRQQKGKLFLLDEQGKVVLTLQQASSGN